MKKPERQLNPKALHNQIDKKVLKETIEQDNRPRRALSFYRYIKIDATQERRNQLYIDFFNLEVLGRIYIANEGVNAQISVLDERFDEVMDYINRIDFLKDIPIKIGLENEKVAFYKLIIKVRKKIVADGLPDDEIDFSKVGEHLTADEFNQRLANPETLVVDVRNHYESEVGHFENALTVDCDTFNEQLPMIRETLKGKEDKPVIMYCTGGIRCEKASAYLRHYGFKDVGQLYGGIINYAHEIQEKNLPNKFKGKNFVFDHRLGERVSHEIISKCHQCGSPCDEHTNCANDECHLLFIQCQSCRKKMENCCSLECQKIASLPIEEQRERRRKNNKKKEGVDAISVYKSRLRPKLKQISH